MRVFFSCAFILLLTLIIGLSWACDFYYGVVFGAFIVSAISLLVFLLSPLVLHYITEFDNGKMSDLDIEKVFKSFHDRPAWTKVYNLLMSILQIGFLVAAGFPILAGIYLISNAISGKLSSSCGKRYKKHIKKD